MKKATLGSQLALERHYVSVPSLNTIQGSLSPKPASIIRLPTPLQIGFLALFLSLNLGDYP
jgi:hypothetical protein